MTILILAEHDNTQLRPATLNAVTAAKELGGEIEVLVAGSGCEGAANDASKIAKRILEMDGSINFKKLRRAMKTFIIMDKSFMGKLSSNLEKAGIPS